MLPLLAVMRPVFGSTSCSMESDELPATREWLMSGYNATESMVGEAQGRVVAEAAAEARESSIRGASSRHKSTTVLELSWRML
ncbi:hypothetical protein MFIFM68171_02208 [Madurella fahalii]|uniref:Secreted protein n=1 Tax=Madurella fahalii TaxID=1157608 RepID=A0ABQ0G2K9_9PEZI